MQIDRRASGLLVCLACGALSSAVAAQTVRSGVEFQVNAYTTGKQIHPSASAAANGSFVVVWDGPGLTDGGYGIFGRRFSRAGAALAAEFQVNVYVTDDQVDPSVASEAGGDFIVAWTSSYQDGSDNGVFARRFTSAGSPIAVEFQVNTYTADAQYGPAVAADTDGDFVIAWSSNLQDGSIYGVFARRFSSAGVALATEFQVNGFTTSEQRRPGIGITPGGDFVIAWQSLQDNSDLGVFARRFTSSGVALAGEFQVNVRTVYYQGDPSVAVDGDGDFIVAWTSYTESSIALLDILARRYSSAGASLGGEFHVNVFTDFYQFGPAVRAEADGDFVVAWQSAGQDGSVYAIIGRRFASAGTPTTAEFQINSYTSLTQARPAVASSGVDFVVAWQSAAQDGGDYGIFAQRFTTPIELDVDGNGAVDALTDTLLALRYVFGFRGNTLITGAVDLVGCTRCDAPAIESYLAGLTSN